MGNTLTREYLSPKQISVIHRNFALKSVRKYLKTCVYNSNNTLTITANENWDFNMYLDRNLTVSSGNILTLQCKLSMPDGATITVNSGATFIIDQDAILTGACDDYWAGNLIVNQGGTLIIKNNSQIRINGTGNIEIKSGAYICIEDGADINLSDYLSVINLRCGYISGINPSTGLTANCTSDPESYPVTGNGVINASTNDPDLYVKDTPQDLGVEPNPDTGPMWVSEDIWNRTTCDNGTIHQNPEYGQQNCVYVKVTNRGCQTSSGNEELRLYWSKASTGLGWPTQWVNYTPTIPDCSATLYGDEITDHINNPVLIPAIDGGQSVIVPISWYPPNPDNFTCFGADKSHFCLLARIEATNDPMFVTETTDVNANVKNNNNIAWKNLTVVDVIVRDIPPSLEKMATIIVRNIKSSIAVTKLKFDSPEENPLINYASIKINLGPALFQKWDNGGRIGYGIEVCSDSTIHLLNPHSWIGNIQLDSAEANVITAIFDLIIQPEECNFNFDISQYTSDTTGDKLVGGNRFTLNCSSNNLRLIAPASENTENILPIQQNEKTHRVKLYPNPANDKITLVFDKETENNTTFEIYDFLGNIMLSKNIPPKSKQITISVSQLTTGIYMYKIKSGDEIIDTDKLIINR